MDLNTADLQAFAELAEGVVAANPKVLLGAASALFLARFGEECVQVALAGLKDDEARRTQVQVSLHKLVGEFQ